MAQRKLRDYPKARGYRLLARYCKVSDADALGKVELALSYLRMARTLYQEAGCPKTLQRVELAINSGKGAIRSVGYRPYQRKRRFEANPPPCLASMGCLCAGHARGDAVDAPCDTSET